MRRKLTAYNRLLKIKIKQMTRRAYFFFICLALFSLFPAATFCQDNNTESFADKSILSLDLSYLGMGLSKNGWGLGVSYERSFFRYLAAKGSFSHMTLYPKDIDTTVTTVGIKLEALLYPFGSGLDKLYLGFGGGTDFLMYTQKDENGEEIKDSIITIYPEIGWKQNFQDYVMADIFVGYRILMSSPEDLSYKADLVDSGIKYGARLKFNLGKIWRWIK